MKIIISPAKKMRVETDIMESVGTPLFLGDAKRLKGILSGYSRSQLKELFCANDSITELNYRRFQEMDLDQGHTPAVLAYVGLQYQSMAPEVFTRGQWEYVGEHLRILSGFYGMVRAWDGVVPYRLEMQAKLPLDGKKDLYGFWGDRLYQALAREGDQLLNLASKEYSKAVEPYLDPKMKMVTCVFAEEAHGRAKVKATAAKMARGAMVRWLAKEKVASLEGAKGFSALGYQFRADLSSPKEYVFTRRP